MSAFVSQCLLAIGALLALALAPPDHGDLLLLPLGPHVSAAGFAFDDGRKVVAVASVGGVVVRGDRGEWFGALRHGVLILSAPAALCGKEVA